MWSLHAQALDRLKDVQETFSFHPLQNVAERDEGAGPTRTGTETKNRGGGDIYRAKTQEHRFQTLCFNEGLWLQLSSRINLKKKLKKKKLKKVTSSHRFLTTVLQ